MTDAPSLETHPHHQKLAAIQRAAEATQAAAEATRKLQAISTAFVTGVLTGALFDRAQTFVQGEIVWLLDHEETR